MLYDDKSSKVLTPSFALFVSQIQLITQFFAPSELKPQDLIRRKSASFNEGGGIFATYDFRSEGDVVLIDEVLRSELPHEAPAAFNEEFFKALAREVSDDLLGDARALFKEDNLTARLKIFKL